MLLIRETRRRKTDIPFGPVFLSGRPSLIRAFPWPFAGLKISPIPC